VRNLQARFEALVVPHLGAAIVSRACWSNAMKTRRMWFKTDALRGSAEHQAERTWQTLEHFLSLPVAYTRVLSCYSEKH